MPAELVIAIFDYLEVKKTLLVTSYGLFLSRDRRIAPQIDTRRLLPSIGRLHMLLTISHDQGWVTSKCDESDHFFVFIEEAKIGQDVFSYFTSFDTLRRTAS